MRTVPVPAGGVYAPLAMSKARLFCQCVSAPMRPRQGRTINRLLGDGEAVLGGLVGLGNRTLGGLLGDHNATMNGLITEGE